jgi:hypothetical protein
MRLSLTGRIDSRNAETPSGSRGSSLQDSTPPRDWFIARLIRSLRENPNGIAGPIVVQFLAMALSSKGSRPRHLSRAQRHEWTKTVIWFLTSMSIDFATQDPQVSEDATWALAQVGVTPADLLGDRSTGDPSVHVATTGKRIGEFVERILALRD